MGKSELFCFYDKIVPLQMPAFVQLNASPTGLVSAPLKKGGVCLTEEALSNWLLFFLPYRLLFLFTLSRRVRVCEMNGIIIM